nr:Ig-like domain-containing protein [Micromonospora sp. DSM 115978]
MGKFTRARAVTAALGLSAVVALTGCGDGNAPRFVEGAAVASSASPTPPPVPVTLAVTPAEGAKKLPVSTEIGIELGGGEVTEVAVTAEGGGAVKGALREDGTSWVPATPLKYATKYTASVTAAGPTGQTETRTTAFTTMAKPGSLIGSGLYLFDGNTYGVAMPVVVEFSPGIPKKDRATVQRRMFVKTDPPQPGAWHWVSNGTQAYYRAPQYWTPGTTLDVRIALEGIPLSNGRYGNVDRSATSKIGDKRELKVENATKKMSVYENDQLVRTMPVSLGKKSTPSSSGTMVIMEKKEATVFDTFAELGPTEGYRTDISFAQRLTWGGEYIHAAPWSVDDQGRRNVSHGCVNLSTPNARWLFERTRVGDPITVTGTERKLGAGNGWTAWNMSWEEFVKGSALPVT